MIKNERGFTLVELLGVVIILTAIFVIVVPIISNAVLDAHKNIAQESAYGYKKAVDDFYYDRSLKKEDILIDGIYEVDRDGILFNDENIYEILFDGDAPKSGLLTYENNSLKDGCITIDKFKVSFVDGEVVSVDNGDCDLDSLRVSKICDNPSYKSSPEEWFTFDASTNTITGFSDAWDGTTNIVIPCSIDGVEVKKIGDHSFWISEPKLDSVRIPPTVVSIGNGAFSYNNLSNVLLSDTILDIGEGAFSNNSIERVRIPRNISTLKSQLFMNNKIKDVYIPDNVTHISSYAFAHNLITDLRLPNDSKKVRSIYEGAFNDNKLPDDKAFIYKYDRSKPGGFDKSILVSYGGENKDVVVSDGVSLISNYAFSDTGLNSIILPDSLTNINNYAFFKNNLTSIDIPDSVQSLGIGVLNDNKLSDDQAIIYARKDGVVDNTKIISYGGASTSVILPSQVKVLGDYAFFKTPVNDITLNQGLVEIGSYSLANTNLSSIIIPSSVTKIGNTSLNQTNVTTVYNNTSRAFNWYRIFGVGGLEQHDPFVTGVIKFSDYDITITSN